MTAHAKKRFGQHFLRDSSVLERLVRLIRPQAQDLIVEIGAGEGALSLRLAPSVAELVAVEIDFDRVEPLRAALEPFPTAFVEPSDFLSLDLSALLGPHMEHQKRLRMVGNLPFNISTAIIEKVLDSGLPVEDMIFMVQLEVAQRIVASPGSRAYGYLSVYCQHHADVRMEFKVPPWCFVPRPKVTSAMITLRPKVQAFDPALERCFQELAKAAFGHRRKTLTNSIRSTARFAGIVDQLLSTAEIKGTLRPEQLTVEDYERLAQALIQLSRSR